MASVFIGEHKLLGSRVAIKVLQKRHLDNPAIERRFLNEAKVIAAIKHSSIVEIYDFGRADNGCAYIVMELLEGETLRKRIRQGVMPERQSMIFARQLASALGAAHREGVIHRDLKPDNVFIIADEEVELGERIKLLDFGIAKRFQNPGPASEQTATGILVGTPAYMSPEQCRGLGDIDGRSDIYSLGVVLYRMITNQLPFEAQGTGELIGKHLYIKPPSAGEVNPEISAGLDAIVSRCLEKEPDKRFQTMSELVSALAEASATTAIDPVRSRAPVVAASELPTEISPVPEPVAAPATPAASEPMSARTPSMITGESVAAVIRLGPPARRGWTVYAAIGCAVALLLGIIAVNAGSGDPAAAAAPDGESEELVKGVDASLVDPETEVAARAAEESAAKERAAQEAAAQAAAKERAAEEAAAKKRAAKEAAAKEAAAKEAAAQEAAKKRAAQEAAAKKRAAAAEARKRRAEKLERARAAEAKRRAEQLARRRAEQQRARAAAAARARAAREKAKAEAAEKKKKTSDVPIHY